jgi:hypothetical protein
LANFIPELHRPFVLSIVKYYGKDFEGQELEPKERTENKRIIKEPTAAAKSAGDKAVVEANHEIGTLLGTDPDSRLPPLQKDNNFEPTVSPRSVPTSPRPESIGRGKLLARKQPSKPLESQVSKNLANSMVQLNMVRADRPLTVELQRLQSNRPSDDYFKPSLPPGLLEKIAPREVPDDSTTFTEDGPVRFPTRAVSFAAARPPLPPAPERKSYRFTNPKDPDNALTNPTSRPSFHRNRSGRDAAPIDDTLSRSRLDDIPDRPRSSTAANGRKSPANGDGFSPLPIRAPSGSNNRNNATNRYAYSIEDDEY